MLWTLPEGVSYESKSIFLEEQTQVVTATLLNSLMKYDSPMMITKTKMSVICGLKSLYKFLEQSEVSGNFANNFRTYLNDTILTHLTNHLELGDLFCVKKIIRKLYEPVFRQRRWNYTTVWKAVIANGNFFSRIKTKFFTLSFFWKFLFLLVIKCILVYHLYEFTVIKCFDFIVSFTSQVLDTQLPNLLLF